MQLRLRITLFFAAIVGLILALIGLCIYYFSSTNRLNNVTVRLTNRALTTSRLWNQYETFNPSLLQKIDSASTMSLQGKVIQVYEPDNKIVYTFSDKQGDLLLLDTATLAKARKEGSVYLKMDEKDVVVYSYQLGTQPVIVAAGAYDSAGIDTLHQLAIILWISLICGLIIAIVAGYIFSKSLLIPLRKIADNVNEISAQNLASRIKTSKNKDEWEYLATTFNQLLNRLQESFETQRRFVANASHELSTPLTSISSQLEVSLQRQRDASEYRRVMLSVYQDVRQLNKLVQTLLEFAKASGSTGGLEIEKIRIDEIVMRMPGDIAKTNQEYTVVLNFESLPAEEEQLWVLGNDDLLYTAIKNIIINACKYSANHQANVTLSVNDAIISISIQDEGEGIPNSEVAHIFQPFYRVGENRSVSGFGLGLSLASRIIKLHKGTIQVNSVVKAGTTFTISLPVMNNTIVTAK